MIFNDIQKLLLYKQPNLGLECVVCQKRFYNKVEYSQHIVLCKNVSESLKCERCGKTFGHQQIYKLHQQFHALSESTNEVSETRSSDTDSITATGNRQTDCDQQLTRSFVTKDECRLPYNFKFFESPKKTASRVSRITKEKPKSANKRIGLTKVRIEDCLRCDDCSCIYIDDKDYYKHMRNFHKLDINNLPIPQPQSKRKCKSCCKQCRGVNCTSALKRVRATQPASNLIFRLNMRDSIKNRWSRMVSQQLSEPNCPTADPSSAHDQQPDIKPDLNELLLKADPEPGIDLSHLLSQVEVKIKTEPDDDFCV